MPAFAFRKLRQLGALMGNSNRLSPRIYEFVLPEFNCISEGLGRLLGKGCFRNQLLVAYPNLILGKALMSDL